MAQENCFSKFEGLLLIKQLGLHESTLGDLRDAEKQHRDSRAVNSIHAREFPNKVCLHRDKYNPEYRLIEHLAVDYIKPEAWKVAGLVSLIALLISKDWKTALKLGIVSGTVTQLLVDNHN